MESQAMSNYFVKISRGTCFNRGVFDCPECTFFWYDGRVGEQTREISDYFSEA